MREQKEFNSNAICTYETNSGYQCVNIESLNLISKNQISLRDEINSVTAFNFALKLGHLVSQNVPEVNIIICSPGGEVRYGWAMIRSIEAARKAGVRIKTYCMGIAASMAALVFLAGDERYILPDSEIMLHEPLLSAGVGGSASSIKSISDNIQQVKAQTNKYISERTGKNLKEVTKACSYDHYFSADEALQFGIVTEITEFLL